MNDIEKAIEILKEEKKFIDKHGSYYGDISYFDLAISALEKQVLKQVTNDGRSLPEGTAYCPSCGAYLSIFHKFCFNCGQALEANNHE